MANMVYIKGEKAQTLRMAASDPLDVEESEVRLASMSIQWQEEQLAEGDMRTEDAWVRLHIRVTGKRPIFGASVGFMVDVMTDSIRKMGYPIITSGLSHDSIS